MEKIVLALGGNALGIKINDQIKAIEKAVVYIADLIEEGYEVVITHGNGPQVGLIHDAFEDEMPYVECVAMSQGYIGFHLQNILKIELNKRKIPKEVSTIITQVEIDKNDSAFKNPTKPVGEFLTEEVAKQRMKESGDVYREDAGRGWRKLVPSPLPIDILEKNIVKTLMELDQIVITVGGGGIPVIMEENNIAGVDAIIDKDFASAKLAEIIDADYLLILTAVENVAINYNKKDEKKIDTMTVAEANKYIEEEQFAKGSMLPKVQAAINFANSEKGKTSIITSLSNAVKGIHGEAGTRIIK